MKKEDLLNDEFLKQFTSSQELSDFLSVLQKRGIEKMLEGELDAHLGYDKNQKSANTNSRNGYTQKNIRTSCGDSRIQVPRDREASFNPMLIPKRESMTDGFLFCFVRSFLPIFFFLVGFVKECLKTFFIDFSLAVI